MASTSPRQRLWAPHIWQGSDFFGLLRLLAKNDRRRLRSFTRAELRVRGQSAVRDGQLGQRSRTIRLKSNPCGGMMPLKVVTRIWCLPDCLAMKVIRALGN